LYTNINRRKGRIRKKVSEVKNAVTRREENQKKEKEKNKTTLLLGTNGPSEM